MKYLSPENLPAGTRFIYKNNYGELCDGRVYEWSPSNDYVNISGQWYNVNSKTTIYEFTIVEVLDKESVVN